MDLAVSNCGFVATGAVCGALSRYGVAELSKSVNVGRPLPPYAGTIAVNIAGSFLLGCIAGGFKPGSPGVLLAGVGFCGSFTTFSTFAVDAVKLLSSGQVAQAALYVASSNALSIGAAAAGMQFSSSPRALAAINALAARRPMIRQLFPGSKG